MSDAGFIHWVGELARRHTRQLAALARAEGLSATDALDAVQEGLHTFLTIPHARDLAQEAEDSARLLTVVVRNTARNMRRRHHRALSHDEGELVGLVDDVPPVEELLAQAEEHVRLRGCVDMLGQLQRRVITLRMLEEASGEAVARELDLRPGHVAVLLYRAKKAIERCLIE